MAEMLPSSLPERSLGDAQIPRQSNALQRRLRLAAGPLLNHLVERIPKVASTRIQAEDILQEVWVAAFRAEELLLQLADDEFSRWLRRVANRRLVSALRHHLNQKRGAYREFISPELTSSLISIFDKIASPQKTPSSLAARNEIAIEVQRAIENLPDINRQAILMHHMEGLSPDEIAPRLKRSPNAVRGILYRGMTQLSETLRYHDKSGSPQ